MCLFLSCKRCAVASILAVDNFNTPIPQFRLFTLYIEDVRRMISEYLLGLVRCVCAWINPVVPFIVWFPCCLSHGFDCFRFSHTSCCCCCCGRIPFTSPFWSRLVLVLLPFPCWGAIHPSHVTVHFICGKKPIVASFKSCSWKKKHYPSS